MNNRERILTVLRRERPDRIPFSFHWRHLRVGEVEREVRNRGMAVCYTLPCYTASMPHVEVVERSESSTGRRMRIIEYHTPEGMVSMKRGEGAGIHSFIEERDWRGIGPYVVEHLVKKPEDYDVLKFMVEDTVYKPNYDVIRDAQRWVGGDGIVIASLPYSPFQMMLVTWVGVPTLYVHYARYRDKVEEMYRVIDGSYEELYRIAADSPAELINYGENLDGFLVSPPYFERYYIPAYQKCARVLHERGKFMASHFDGRLKALSNLIAKCPHDVIEAFHPPPMGDLPLNEALSLWRDKVLFMGFPGSIYSMGPNAVRRYLLELLETAAPGDRLLLFASTETPVPEDCLLALTNIMEKATLPLSNQVLQSIRGSLN